MKWIRLNRTVYVDFGALHKNRWHYSSGRRFPNHTDLVLFSLSRTSRILYVFFPFSIRRTHIFVLISYSSNVINLVLKQKKKMPMENGSTICNVDAWNARSWLSINRFDTFVWVTVSEWFVTSHGTAVMAIYHIYEFSLLSLITFVFVWLNIFDRDVLEYMPPLH